MLRIKEDKYKEFCDNAEKLGFKINEEYFVFYKEGEIEIIESRDGELTLYVGAYVFRQDKDDFHSFKYTIYDKLYDLIINGYVDRWY